MITREQIVQFAPSAKADLVNAILRNWDEAVAAGIEKNPKRLRRFMASIGVETGGLKSVSENLNYTSAERIFKIFNNGKKRFASVAACGPYVREPEKLAIKVYGGRLGNKAAPSKDGWLYRGAGMMQTTGRTNFAALGFEDNPDALRDPETAFLTAVREWTSRKCNALADREDDHAVRKAINGGLNGYDEYLAYVRKATKVWADASDDDVVREYSSPSDGDDAEESPTPRPREERRGAAYTDRDTVLRAQTMLRALGYTEVGEPDGKIGKFTKSAILAFRSENDLPLADPPVIDDELLAALGSAKPREIATARAEAKPAEVRAAVPEVKSNFFAKIGAYILGVPAALGALVSGAMDNLGISKETLAPIKGFFSDIPPVLWFVLVGGVALSIYLVSRGGEKAGTEAYQAGARR